MSILYKNSDKFLFNSTWRDTLETNSGFSEAKINPVIETILKGDNINIDNTKVTITDPYGIRTFDGREGKHSTGIDMVTNTGKAVSLQDGVIEKVSLQGSGKIITPTEGSAAGYYVTVKNSDGTRTQYMHLDPMTNTDMESLQGKKIKRGEDIWGYSTGSGSMTGPHVKVRQYQGNPKNHMDPTSLFKGIRSITPMK